MRIACRDCPQASRHHLPGLVARFGPRAGLPDVLAALSAECARRDAGHIGDPCGAYFADLVHRITPPT
jgi:hypothetical protein